MFYDPVHDHLVISNAMGVQMAEIFRVTGSLLTMLKIINQETFEIDLHSFPAGIYLIKLNLGSGGIRLNKFIKK